MRRSTVSIVVAAALASGPPAAIAQTTDPVSQAAGELPPTLFEPAPDAVPSGAVTDEATGTPLLLAGFLLAGAAAAGYFTGSLRRTRRS
jgi:hypothetical protein